MDVRSRRRVCMDARGPAATWRLTPLIVLLLVAALAAVRADAASAADYVPPGAGDRGFHTYVGATVDDRQSVKINVASGNLLVQSTDVRSAGTGLDLVWARSYNSLRFGDVGAFGYGWTGFTADVRLKTDASNNTLLVGDSGYVANFGVAPNFVTPSGMNATLVRNANST